MRVTAHGETTLVLAVLTTDTAPAQGVGDDDVDPRFWWLDTDTGIVWQQDPDTGEWVPGGPLTPPAAPPLGYPGDNAPPPAVTGLVVTPGQLAQPDGTIEPILRAAWSLATPLDIIGYELQWAASPATYSRPLVLKVGRDVDQSVLSPVLGGTAYDVRIRAYDTEAKVGPWSSVVTATALGDTTAPGIPTGLEVVPGFKAVAAFWDRNTEPDLSHYGVRYRQVGAADWTVMVAKVTRLVIADLVSDIAYEVQVRAVDRSDNTVTSAADPTAVRAIANPDAGWTASVMATPSLIAPSDLYVPTLVADFISTGVLDASLITVGNIEVGGPGMAGGIRIYDVAGRPIGMWDEDGWLIADPLTGYKHAIWAGQDAARGMPVGIYFTDDYKYSWNGTGDPPPLELGVGGSEGVYHSVWKTAIDARGVNAEAITFGSVQGGSNRVLNAGIELAAYPVAAPVTYRLTSPAGTPVIGWDVGRKTSIDVNMDFTQNDLKMSTI